MASTGSNGLTSPRPDAVAGMNCAIPCAPFGLMASGLNRLSCQMRRVKKSRGRPLSAAAWPTTRQMSVAAGRADLPCAAAAAFAGSVPAVVCGSAATGSDSNEAMRSAKAMPNTLKVLWSTDITLPYPAPSPEPRLALPAASAQGRDTEARHNNAAQSRRVQGHTMGAQATPNRLPADVVPVGGPTAPPRLGDVARLQLSGRPSTRLRSRRYWRPDDG